jgi:hypothetical protein
VAEAQREPIVGWCVRDHDTEANVGWYTHAEPVFTDAVHKGGSDIWLPMRDGSLRLRRSSQIAANETEAVAISTRRYEVASPPPFAKPHHHYRVSPDKGA